MKLLTHFNPFLDTIFMTMSKLQALSLTVPKELANLQATVGEEIYYMQSHAWNQKHFAYIRLTYLSSSSRVEMFNLAMYPNTCYETPIFASDFVIVGNTLRVAVIDAMPMFPQSPVYVQTYQTPFAGLFEKAQSLGQPYERSLDWSFHFMGPYACLRQHIPLDCLDELHTLWHEYLSLYLNLTQSVTSISATQQTEVVEWHQKYNRQHLEVERKRNPLMHYFGQELGTQYLEKFLFKV